MSHMILTNDKIVSVEKCWHGLETIVPEITFENSGLNWNVVSRPLYLDADSGPVEGWQAVVRDDKNIVLNIPRASYGIIQNSRVWEAIENSLAGVNHKIAVAGSLHDCKRIFISVALSDHQEYVANREKFKAHLTFVSSHDGSMALEAFDCMTRVVCQNTLTMARGEKGAIDCKVFHTKDNEIKIQNMEATIEALFVKREEWLKSYEYLASRPMSMELANKVLNGFVINSDDSISTRGKNQVSAMLDLFMSGNGNNGKTYADLLNGVTDYYTHLNNKKNAFSNFTSSEFGNAAKIKADFFGALMSDKELEALAKRGEKLLLAAV